MSTEKKARVRKKERKNITSGVAHVNATFNNTMITITDAQGNTVAWSSAGTMGFMVRASRRRTPRRLPPKTLARRRWNTACARWKSK